MLNSFTECIQYLLIIGISIVTFFIVYLALSLLVRKYTEH